MASSAAFLASEGDVKAGMMGMMSAGIAGEIGKINDLSNFSRSALHGITQGAVSAAGGGRFGDGALGAFSGSYFSFIPEAVAGPYGSGGEWAKIGRMTAAAVVGGTASALGGGKFANGAWSAAFVSRFNHDGAIAADEIAAPSSSSTQPVRDGTDAATVFEYFYPRSVPHLSPAEIDAEGVQLANTMTVAAAQAQGKVNIIEYFTPNPAAGPRGVGSFLRRIFYRNVDFGAGGLYRQDYLRQQLSALGAATKLQTAAAYRTPYLELRCRAEKC